MTYEEYLNIREITNFTNETYLYIKDGKLYVYFDINKWASEETLFYLEKTNNYFVIE